MSENGNTIIRLCGLWKAPGEKGDYLSGRLGNAKVFVFRNKSKASEKSPDYWVCLAPAPKDGNSRAADSPKGGRVCERSRD